jgi:hypothetical protein
MVGFLPVISSNWHVDKGGHTDLAALVIAESRWAHLAGIGSRRSTCFPVGAFGWYPGRSMLSQAMLHVA